VPPFGLIRIGQEVNQGALRRYHSMRDPWERFFSAFNPESIQLDLSQFDAKVPIFGGQKFEPAADDVLGGTPIPNCRVFNGSIPDNVSVQHVVTSKEWQGSRAHQLDQRVTSDFPFRP
jgi:hypothetical protein